MAKSENKSDTIIMIAIIFFVALASFSLGTFVGKGISETDRRRADLEQEYSQVRNIASKTETKKDEDKISEDEIAKLTKEFIKKEESANEKATELAETGATPNSDETESNEKESEEAKLAHTDSTDLQATDKETDPTKRGIASTEKQTAKTEEVTLDDTPEHSLEATKRRIAKGLSPKSEIPPIAEKDKPIKKFPKMNNEKGQFTIQVGSYSSEEEAKKESEKFQKRGYSAFYIEADVGKKKWFRVNIGLFGSIDSANKFKATLAKQARVKSSFVKKIVR